MKRIYFYLIALAVALLDQYAKHLITQHYAPDASYQVNRFLQITLVENRGTAFGMFQSNAALCTIINLAAVIAIILVAARKSRMPKSLAVSLSLLLGGAIGNLIDRLFLGHVVDFIDFGFWPVFNIADMAIVIGVILLAWQMLFHGSKTAKAESESVVTDV